MGERFIPMLELINLEPWDEIPWPHGEPLTWMDEMMEDYELEMTVTEKPQ